ncbi:Nicotinamide-nucleotide amidohydrolase PncC [Zhongshania aliphaticivorans]|uniref:CinA-like protein n=1 Tax=Zhongshania aliphaticivorans TaxID=1470434 RepID=A0A5S9NIY3_9GAMM|nr:CinA family nicotinamide mononucleotide deamidase-related protein [Zhongshania aliphaticivorans]CAA0089741.1 Nicotinamide-nucleotide amidohydrolase PncC [Zhongshania aliphaticivorans]CAA0096699.1 Nicotinamide-nucleotide amidohydrolase PncC [Zhongshania aliphaticivorans]
MKLQLLLTGNELMAGDTIDSNSSMIAQLITEYGWRIDKKVTVGDDLKLLEQQIQHLANDCEVLIINGGLGPTVDDMTSLALAGISGNTLCEHPDALAHLTQWCNHRGFKLNASNLKQTMLPAGSQIIANSRGSAVGIKMLLGNCLILATPGVPSELRAMMNEEIIPLLSSQFPSDYIQTQRLAVFGLGESSIQELVNKKLPNWPNDVELGFRASMPVLEVKLTTRGKDASEKLHVWRQHIIELIGDHLLGDMPLNLAQALIAALNKNGQTVCTAESCTGGNIAAQITSVAGSSHVFPGGIVSYSNELKQNLLAVSEASLATDGAVSATVARQMAEGALKATGANLAIAVTGIAGPEGGSEEKPVGTVWMAWGNKENLRVEKFFLPLERHLFQTLVTALGLDLLRRYTLGIPGLPELMTRRRS